MNAITLYRAGNWAHRRRLPLIPHLCQRLNFLLFNAYIPFETEIGEGTSFGYGGMGVVLHPRCRIGRNVLIAQQVSIGGRSGRYEVPVIEDDCFIGPGARILGPIRIGRCSVVGANAVVIADVPSHTVVAGVPARIIRQGIDINDYHKREAA